jgi:ABC-type transporter Mla subunit MlaD
LVATFAHALTACTRAVSQAMAQLGVVLAQLRNNLPQFSV